MTHAGDPPAGARDTSTSHPIAAPQAAHPPRHGSYVRNVLYAQMSSQPSRVIRRNNNILRPFYNLLP
jgi:hypothetical protein